MTPSYHGVCICPAFQHYSKLPLVLVTSSVCLIVIFCLDLVMFFRGFDCTSVLPGLCVSLVFFTEQSINLFPDQKVTHWAKTCKIESIHLLDYFLSSNQQIVFKERMRLGAHTKER